MQSVTFGNTDRDKISFSIDLLLHVDFDLYHTIVHTQEKTHRNTNCYYQNKISGVIHAATYQTTAQYASVLH